MRLVVTTGEPAGIGPEISVRAALALQLPCTLIGDAALLEARTRALGLPWPLPASIGIDHVALAVEARPGVLDPRNGRYVLATLDRAIEACMGGAASAMATSPVQKSVINDAGVPFTGHTEYLEEKSATPHVVMMLVGGGLRVALATTHLALAKVPAAITFASLTATLDVMQRDLVGRFGLAHPRIGVAGLNPHAGEGGHMGREEIDVIAPALAAARERGIDASGPLPADTLFVPHQLARFDAVLAMYHDQGLPVLKHASFGHGVNVTLGLPFVRTSADHGTALDLAGKGTADPGSMLAALKLAQELADKSRATTARTFIR